MPIFSLPSKYGMGSFGKEGYRFVDFLVSAKQSLWQILPLVQTGFGNSPYSSVCSDSLNPYFISVELLRDEGLLTDSELQFAESKKSLIDYSEIFSVRYPLLRKAFARFNTRDARFFKYVNSGESLDYALFMSIKYASGQKPFYEWEDGLKHRDRTALKAFMRDYDQEILFWQFVQYKAKEQWQNLKDYANKRGVQIMGDMPLYVALDSVDVWKNPELFKLDENFAPKKVAGVPPDYFCEDGQLWGNPVYDYDEHKKDGFSWWITRIKKALGIFDYVRIDHFRGFDRYFEVDSDRENAKVGEWIDVPSKELFDAIHKQVAPDRIIAEDLGIIDDGVRELLKYTRYPGMKILSFAFNGEDNNLYLPENIEENSVCYTGTHDNDTLRGLIENASEWDRDNLVRGVEKSLDKFELDGDSNTLYGLMDAIIELGFCSKANTFILPMQDVLRFGSDYRINEPGVVSEKNWAVRFNDSDFTKSVADKLKKLTIKYNR